jgi:hypothetical protein
VSEPTPKYEDHQSELELAELQPFGELRDFRGPAADDEAVYEKQQRYCRPAFRHDATSGDRSCIHLMVHVSSRYACAAGILPDS